MSDTTNKKGFIHYLTNPADAAKKLFPFIDIDAMMESNKERYEALGVNPESGKNLMGMALNPVAAATGFGAGYGINKALGGAYKLYSRSRARKDMLSDAGWSRFQSNAIDRINDEIHNIGIEDYILKRFPASARNQKKILANKAKLKNLEDDLKYIKSPASKSEYIKDTKTLIDKTPIRIGYNPRLDGKAYVREPYGIYKRSTGETVIRGDRPIKDFFGGTGTHELGHAAQNLPGFGSFRPGGKINLPKSRTTSLSGWKEKAQKYLDETAVGPSGVPQGEVNAKLLDIMEDGAKNRIGLWKDISQPHEISARLKQFRTQPKFYDFLIKKGLYKPHYYEQLEQIFQTPQRIKRAAKDVWGAAPIGLMDLAKKD